MPTATARPDREIMFSVTPEKYISTTAKITLTGIATSVITVGRQSFKNRYRITMANSAPQPRLDRMALMMMYMYSP